MKTPLLLLMASAMTSALCTGQDANPAPAHDHAPAGAEDPKRKELLQGITEADFLRLGKEPKSVEVVLVAVFSDANYGMNFNGYGKGGATYTIPKGWNVHVRFINPSPVPHSLIVIDKEDVKKLQVAEPFFKGAAIEKHLQGVAYEKREFTFVPDEAGAFAFACGFPAHALNGHWVALQVSATAEKPSLKLGDGEAKDASPAK